MKVVLVGNGYFGGIYRERIESDPNYDLVGVVDPNVDRLRSLSGMTVGHEYESFRCVEHEAVIICTPPDTHKGIAMLAMDRGKHVMCAKPGALSVEDCAYLHGVADAKNVAYMVDYTMLWAPEMNVLDQQFSALGEPVKMRSYRDVVTGPKPEGIIWDLLCHDVAIFYEQMLNKRIVSVKCSALKSAVIAHVYDETDEHWVGSFSASYNATRPLRIANFIIDPYKEITNPRVSFEWNQIDRFVEINSQGKSIQIHCSRNPDPVSLALMRFGNATRDRFYAEGSFSRHMYVTSILQAFQHSANHSGMRTVVNG